MSYESPDVGPEPEPIPAPGGPAFRRRCLGLPRRRTRWLAAVVVVVLGGGVLCAGLHHWAHRGGDRAGFAAAERYGEHGRLGGPRHGPGRQGLQGRPRPNALAPAPVPSFPTDQAVQKAAGAVPGGEVDSLRVVRQQGGGSAWQLDVIGPDGVRHTLTIDGTNGSITSNTVANGGKPAGN